MKKTKHFLFFSAAVMVLFSLGVFIWMARFMDKTSEQTIHEIGTLYMTEMSRHIQQKFLTIMDERLQQLEGIIKRTPPQSVTYGEDMLRELNLNARVRDFTYLGLYSKNGDAQTVHGFPINLLGETDFWSLLEKDDKLIGYATDGQGERLAVLALPAKYPMKDGKTSAAIVAGFPMEEINDALFLHENKEFFYSHVINQDGRFIIRPNQEGDNYFQKIHKMSSLDARKNFRQYEQEIREAMYEKAPYSALVRLGSSRQHQHLYLSALPNTDWFLITVMPQTALEKSVRSLSRERSRVTVLAAAAMLFLFFLIFAYYYALSGAQMKRLNQARRESDRANKAKSEFLSNMSHDIRTPMNAVVGMTDIALANITNPSRVTDCLKKIQLSSKHLLGLINDVLDMSKIESGKLKLNIDRLSLRQTMDDLVSIIQPQIKAKHQKFDIFIHKIISEDVFCDSVRLNQILLNLLSNSIKFTPNKGSVSVFLFQEPAPLGAEYVRTHLRVKDTGIGMSAEFKEKLFESFSREDSARVHKTMGTGLGMAITKYLVDQMKGTIDVQSEPDKGTEFHITLDLKKVPNPEEKMRLPAWNMLVVDDNAELCESAAAALAELGVRAECAGDGETAVKKMEQRLLNHQEYDIVLVDWQMPGMDGLQTIRAIHERINKDVPVFLISAYDWSAIKDEALQSGVSGFIAKPLFKSTLFYGLNPYSKQKEASHNEGTVPKSCPLRGKRILLAEDNELNYEVAREILAAEGMEIEWAQNGQICVEKLKHSAPWFYDAILMDIRMPVMTGYEAARAIRALDRADKNIPIIAMTADAFSEDVQRALASGMNAHTAKPINTQELLRLLCRHMGIDAQAAGI